MKQKLVLMTKISNITSHLIVLYSSISNIVLLENSKEPPWPHYPLFNVMVMEMNLYYVKVSVRILCSQ